MTIHGTGICTYKGLVLLVNVYPTLGIQVPSQKVLGPSWHLHNSVSNHHLRRYDWIPRVGYIYIDPNNQSMGLAYVLIKGWLCGSMYRYTFQKKIHHVNDRDDHVNRLRVHRPGRTETSSSAVIIPAVPKAPTGVVIGVPFCSRSESVGPKALVTGLL